MATNKTKDTQAAHETEKNCFCQGCTNTNCTCAGMKNAADRASCDGHNNCAQGGCTYALKRRTDEVVADEAASGSNANIVMIPINRLNPHPDNPRKDVGDVTELAESIKANGVLQNLTVVPYFSPVHKRVMNGVYTVIIGHRRLAAAKKAGLTEMPCVIVEMSEKDQLSTMLTENMQRVDLTVYEQAQGFQMMLDMGDTMEEIAEKSGFSKTTVRKRLEIAKLDDKTLKKVSSRQLSLGDFDELAKIEDIEVRNRVLASMGTANFKNELQTALRDQQTAKRMEEWLEVIRTFATEDPTVTYGTHQYITNYCNWNLTKDVVVPEDAGTVKYYYKVSKNSIEIYKDKDLAKEAADKAEREEQQRKAEQRRLRYEDINDRHYNLRADFVKSLSNAVCKKNAYKVFSYVANTMYILAERYNSEIDLDVLGYLLGVKIDEKELADGEPLTEFPGIRSALEAFPEKTLFCMAVAAMDDISNGYWKRQWNCGEYAYQHYENDQLNELYDVLTALGYEMSDEEKEMQSGDHIVFIPGCDTDDEDDESLDPEDLADLDDLVEEDVDED